MGSRPLQLGSQCSVQKTSRSALGTRSGCFQRRAVEFGTPAALFGTATIQLSGSGVGVSGSVALAFLKRRDRVARPVFIPAPRSGRPESS